MLPRVAGQQEPHDGEENIVHRQSAEPDGPVVHAGTPVDHRIQQVDAQGNVQGNLQPERHILQKPLDQRVPADPAVGFFQRRDQPRADNGQGIGGHHIGHVGHRAFLPRHQEGVSQQPAAHRDAQQHHRRTREQELMQNVLEFLHFFFS